MLCISTSGLNEDISTHKNGNTANNNIIADAIYINVFLMIVDAFVFLFIFITYDLAFSPLVILKMNDEISVSIKATIILAA